MAAVVHPAFQTHSRGYGHIGTTPTHMTRPDEQDQTTPRASSSGKKPRMEVYIELPSRPRTSNAIQAGKPKKSLDKKQKTTLDKYFAKAVAVEVPRVSLGKKKPALSDKPLNVASPRRDSGIVIDLTDSPIRKRKAGESASNSDGEGKKGKKAKIDENGKTKKKAARGADEQPAAAKRVRKVVEPVWTELVGFDDREEVEARIHLREFIVRFRPILRLAKSHIDALDEFATVSRETAKAVTNSLLDLIAVDADSKQKLAVKLAMKEVTAAMGDPAQTWAALKKLLETTYGIELAVPASATEGKTRRSAGRVTRPEQLVDAMIALVDIAIQGESVKLELVEGEKEIKEKTKVWTKAVKEEEDRWQEERSRLMFERPGKLGKGASKAELEREKAYKTKYAAANKAHKQALATLNSEHFLSVSASISRFQPLGRDVDGRVYYVLSPYADGKIPPSSIREDAIKWSWFVFVWGRQPIPAASEPEENKPSPSDNSDAERTLASADSSTLNGDDLLPHWHAFTSPTEIRRLSKWIDHVASSTLTGELPQPEKRDDTLPPTTGKEISSLCEGLNGFADYLEWRCREEDEREAREKEKEKEKGKN